MANIIFTCFSFIAGLIVYKIIKAEKDKELAREKKKRAKEDKRNKRKRT